ncbi:B12-binding domain-containing radical SAM protein [Desulfovibrio aminophilus]|nr:B12-binding domain-containing radical SAM protein [Desulfovibrio aminophilus]MCM0753759.1 B12-binding domain-containing radical SAM protein [Desulfovibrio aminophilus]
MNILLINPKYPETFWSFKHVLRFISKKAAFPPLGLLTVAAILPGGWQKKLVDLNVEPLTDATLDWADVVFVGAMLVQKESAQEAIDRAKAAGKRVVAGGPAFTAASELFTGVDHFVLNEGEITLPMFVRDFLAGTPQPRYTSNEKPDIAKTPAPLWQLIRMKNYATMSVQFSRGCPFNCEFCDIIVMNGRVPRTKSPSQMLGELESLRKAGWRGSVFIVDDNFIGNKDKVKAFLRELITWQKAHKYPFTFFTEASLNLAQDEELMRLMSAANFHKVFLGIETPSLDSLKECSKHQNTTLDLAKAVNAIQSNGMQVMAGFIVGFDSDTERIFETQMQFIQRIGVVTAMVGMLAALPGTRLWHRLQAEDRLLGETSGENTDGSLNFIPKMGVDTLVKGYKDLVNSLYAPKEYYARVNTFLKHYRPTAFSRVTWSETVALFRSFWTIGLRSRAKALYWKLILKTLFTKFKAFPTAVEMAICGLHFEKCARRMHEE